MFFRTGGSAAAACGTALRRNVATALSMAAQLKISGVSRILSRGEGYLTHKGLLSPHFLITIVLITNG